MHCSYHLGLFRVLQLQEEDLPRGGNGEDINARVVVENNNLQNQNDEMGAAAAGAEVQGQQRLQRENSGAEAPDPEPDRPSLFALTWTFFISFFVSLFPEQPGAL